jgi:DNA-binding XRE family transcriptional regulator
MAFTERLAQFRKAKGLTQKDLAAMVGLNQAQLHRHEKGAAEPSMSALSRLPSRSVSLSTSSRSRKVSADQMMTCASNSTRSLNSPGLPGRQRAEGRAVVARALGHVEQQLVAGYGQDERHTLVEGHKDDPLALS